MGRPAGLKRRSPAADERPSVPMRSSLASRLEAFSPQQLALVALGSLALAGAGTAAAAGLLTGAAVRDRPLTGGDQDLARGTVIHADLTRHRVCTKKIEDAQGRSRGSSAP